MPDYDQTTDQMLEDARLIGVEWREGYERKNPVAVAVAFAGIAVAQAVVIGLRGLGDAVREAGDAKRGEE